jgi:hypothetical protein
VEATSTPDAEAQSSSSQETEDYEVPVDPHDGVDCEDCQ